MKGRALILIFLFLLLIISPVSANIFYNPSFEISEIGQGKKPSGWLEASGGTFYEAGTWNTSGYSYNGENYYRLYDGSQPESGGLYQNVDLTGIDTINFYSKATGTCGNCYTAIMAGALSTCEYGPHDWTKVSLDVSSLSGVQQVKIKAYTSGGVLTFYFDMVFDGDTPYPDVIQLNQSSYNDPENIQIDAELPNYDPTNYSYTTRLYGYTYGGWGALTQVDYNESTAMTASTKSIIADINTDWYDLPLYIKAVITRFDKSDYSTTETAESDMVYYNLAQGNTEGEINLNQTYYTDPENIEVEWNITGYNTTFFNYEIQVITSISGDPSQDSWPADGNWNTSPFISSASGAAVFDFYSDGYDLPIWIQGELWAQDKNTGTWTKLDNTPVVVYHEAVLEPGKIWMDQAVYDTGDTATVSYETVSDSAYVIVRKYPKAVWSQGEYYIWNVLAGSGTRTFVIPPSGTGDWKAELSESDITVNETMFSVNETITPFLAWDDIDGIIGESQILHFYSNDVNATLQIYDGDQTVIYDETVGDGYFHDYVISTHTNQAPGTWTASLNCSGSYYNDTLLMYAKDAYVAFDADAYTLGQTISIQYYLKRSTQTIVLYDANNKDVITWTTTGNYVHLGSGSVDFTLSDDNEYGQDIIAGVDANDIKLGLWKVEVLDRGQPIADNPVYDSAKVSESVDDPADVSNEMISIFFSPEGVFMLYTVCLTMLGLVLSKHPAGGGAGATVGVGFGVYFNVLPPWMLMLTVILLVALGGVSVAAHYRGK